MFHGQGKKKLASPSKPLKNLTKILPVAQFLADEKRRQLLLKIKDLSALDPSRYESLSVTLVTNLVNYYQSLPETSNSYYSLPCGLLDHALNRTEAALSLFKQFIVVDTSGELSEQQKLWQYALYTAGLLQGVGKLFSEFKISLYDSQGQFLKTWNPLLENLTVFGKYYDYSFEKEAEVDFRRRLNLLLAKTIIPASGFAWLASDAKVLAVWLALLNEDERSAGTLGAILIRADAIALQRFFSTFMVKGQSGSGGGFARVRTFTDAGPETLDKEQKTGIEFIQWLTKALAEGKIQMNKTPLFMVPGGMLMSAELFQWFMREHPEFKNWQIVQKGFLSLGLHSLGAEGQALARFEQANNQQIHQGVVFNKYSIALPEQVTVYNRHTGETKTQQALGFTHESGNFIAARTPSSEPAGLEHLSTNGQWVSTPASPPVSHQPGVTRRG